MYFLTEIQARDRMAELRREAARRNGPHAVHARAARLTARRINPSSGRGLLRRRVATPAVGGCRA